MQKTLYPESLRNSEAENVSRGRSVWVREEDYNKLVRLQGLLQAKRGRIISIGDVVHELLEVYEKCHRKDHSQ